MIFQVFQKKFQVYFLNSFDVASNYFWINVYIKISPNQKYIISTVSQGSHISGLTKFHDISMIFIIFLQNSMIFPGFPGVLYFSRFSSKYGNPVNALKSRTVRRDQYLDVHVQVEFSRNVQLYPQVFVIKYDVKTSICPYSTRSECVYDPH